MQIHLIFKTSLFCSCLFGLSDTVSINTPMSEYIRLSIFTCRLPVRIPNVIPIGCYWLLLTSATRTWDSRVPSLKKLVSHSIDVNVFHFFCHLREGEAYINMVQIINHCTYIVRTYLPCDSNLFFVRLYRLKCRNFLFVYIAFAICYHAWQCELYESMLVYAALYPHESLVIIINVFHNADITGSIAQLYIHCT